LQPLPLLPWLAPLLQQQVGSAMHQQRQQQVDSPLPLLLQQQQQHTVQVTQQQQGRALLQAAQQQLHLQQYSQAFPQLRSLLQQQRQQQRSRRRRHRQQALQHNQQQSFDATQAALLQQRRQRQLEQLQRLGQAAAAALPSRNVFAKMQQQLKPARLPTRKSLQYENCRILAPDGRPLATCGIKKVGRRGCGLCWVSAWCV
jgi:hypothetical protein